MLKKFFTDIDEMRSSSETAEGAVILAFCVLFIAAFFGIMVFVFSSIKGEDTPKMTNNEVMLEIDRCRLINSGVKMFSDSTGVISVACDGEPLEQ